MALDEAFWLNESQELERIVLRALQSAAVDGAQGALDRLLAEFGVGVDWATVNTSVADWARTYSADLVRGITATTRTFVQDAVGAWVESGKPLDDLITSLEPTFGATRAQMVASTEVTRSFATGNQLLWQESGVVDGMVWRTTVDDNVCPICSPLEGQKLPLDTTDIPPAHVRCRCWIQPQVNLP